ncbi:hypothetical protein QTP88_024993 [Uroleucon formosanum]
MPGCVLLYKLLLYRHRRIWYRYRCGARVVFVFVRSALSVGRRFGWPHCVSAAVVPPLHYFTSNRVGERNALACVYEMLSRPFTDKTNSDTFDQFARRTFHPIVIARACLARSDGHLVVAVAPSTVPDHRRRNLCCCLPVVSTASGRD